MVLQTSTHFWPRNMKCFSQHDEQDASVSSSQQRLVSKPENISRMLMAHTAPSDSSELCSAVRTLELTVSAAIRNEAVRLGNFVARHAITPSQRPTHLLDCASGRSKHFPLEGSSAAWRHRIRMQQEDDNLPKQ
mmetsp:Transcript_13589/g.29248  ORF Transcript_13589/g.29248 Transcript_13589/m.29248 type:complete len:134 (-) Transcript_13589:22-423(-)